jgi:hypothetical protein
VEKKAREQEERRRKANTLQTVEKKSREQEERRRKANTLQTSRSMSKTPEVTDSFLADSFGCPLLDLAPPFENSCTLPSPDYTFSSAQPSPTPSAILRLASDIQENPNSTAVAPNTEVQEQTINDTTDRVVESPVSSTKKPRDFREKVRYS